MTLNYDHRITIQIFLNILYITVKSQCNIKLSLKSSKKVIETGGIGDIPNILEIKDCCYGNLAHQSLTIIQYILYILVNCIIYENRI
jgi:hypothetical protein